jgi:hypothetical protein
VAGEATMMIKARFRLLAVLLATALHAQVNRQEHMNQQVKATWALIETGAVTRVLVFHVPDSMMTRVAITPKALLSMAASEYEIRGKIEERLKPVFAAMTFQQEDRIPDLRWGLQFYDAGNHKVGEVFVDKFGRYGYVSGRSGSFQAEKSGSNLAQELHKLTGDRR